MEWPIQPVEIQRRFVPRFCPRRDCPAHRGFDRAPAPAALDSTGRRSRPVAPFHQAGSFTRADGRRVVRYRCRAGNHGFSKQAFAVSYYLKRPELILPVAAGLQAGSAHRQLARSLRCAPSTVTRLSARLGRHALLFQATSLAALGPLDESIVLDHFEVFARSQDYPFGIATPVGSESLFVYGVDPAPHARTGRLTPAQRARQRALPPQPSRGGYAGSTRRILEVLLGISPATATGTRTLRLISDGHPDYRRVLGSKAYRDRVAHEVHPNPKRGPKGSARSPEAIARDAAMFPSDQLHSFLRHTVAHHRRETIAFGRRLNAVMERMFLTVAWKNFIKGVSERKPDATTPAMRKGLAKAPWRWPRVFARRLFPDRISLPPAWRELYRREWTTPGGPNSVHQLQRAF